MTRASPIPISMRMSRQVDASSVAAQAAGRAAATSNAEWTMPIAG